MKRKHSNTVKTPTSSQNDTHKSKPDTLTARGVASIRRLNAAHRETRQHDAVQSLGSLCALLEAKVTLAASEKSLPTGFVRFNMLMTLAQRHDVGPAFFTESGLNKESACSLPEGKTRSALLALVRLVAEQYGASGDAKEATECLHNELRDLDMFKEAGDGNEKGDDDDNSGKYGNEDHKRLDAEKKKSPNDKKKEIGRRCEASIMERRGGTLFGCSSSRTMRFRECFGRGNDIDSSDDDERGDNSRWHGEAEEDREEYNSDHDSDDQGIVIGYYSREREYEDPDHMSSPFGGGSSSFFF